MHLGIGRDVDHAFPKGSVQGAQKGFHIPTLRPKYIPYSYMDPVGSRGFKGRGRALVAFGQANLGTGLLCLGGQGDLVSRLIKGILRVTISVIGVINLLTKSP